MQTVKLQNRFILVLIISVLFIKCSNKNEKSDNYSDSLTHTKTFTLDTDILKKHFPGKENIEKPLVSKVVKEVIEAPESNISKINIENIKKTEAGIPVKRSIGKDSFSLSENFPAEGRKVLCKAPEVNNVKEAYTRDKNPYSFCSYSKAQGLKHDVIRCITQDKNGNLWIGTDGGGVSKYDGKNFIHYSEKEGLISNFIWAISEDNQNNIWFGTKTGIVKYDGKNFISFPEIKGLANSIVMSIFKDRKGNMWFSTYNSGLWKYNENSFTNFTTKQGLSSNSVFAVTEDSENNIWIGTTGGLDKFDGNSFDNYTINEGLSSNTIYSLAADKNNNIWVGTGGAGLIKFDGTYFTNYNIENGISDNTVWSITIDEKNNLWLGTFNGFTKYDRKSFYRFGENEGFINKPTWAIFIDKSKNFWLGTYGYGLVKFNGKTFSHVNDKNSPIKHDIKAIHKDIENNIWFGTTGEGLIKYDKESYTIFNNEYNSAKEIYYITEDKNQNLWFGTFSKGIVKFDGKSFTNYTTKQGLAGNKIWTLYFDKKNNLWIGTDKGISKFNGEYFINITKNEGLSNDIIKDIIEDDKGNIWFGTDGGGILKYNGKTFTNYTIKNDPASNHVWSIVKDKKENLWFGTSGGGFIFYNGEKFTSFSDKEGFSNNFVFKIIVDKSDNIWFGTRFGISKLSFDKKEKFTNFISESKKLTSEEKASFNIKNAIFKTYTQDEGFFGIGINGGKTLLESKDGKIWIGANERLTIYNPEGDIPDTISPNIQLTNIEISGEKIEWTRLLNKKDTAFILGNGIEFSNFKFDSLSNWFRLPQNLSLAYYNNKISFNFIGITTNFPKKVKYQYKLEGLEKNWNNITDKTYAAYSNLEYKKYTFVVKAMNSDGYWSKEFKYNFTVRPPWWETNWFKFIYITLFFVLLYGLYRWRTSSLRKRKIQLEDEVQKATNEILEKNENLKQLVEEVTTQKDEITFQNNQLSEQKGVIENIHREVSQSIDYAMRLQAAVLPDNEVLNEYFADHFIIYKPKDKVSGDFYWWAKVEKHLVVAVSDCTGHGVPGAFMSMLGISFLREIVMKEYITHPGVILRRLRKEIIQSLKQNDENDAQKDGMDMSIMSFNIKDNSYQWAGAYNPIWILRANDNKEYDDPALKIEEIKPDKMPIGIHKRMDKFTNHDISLNKSDRIFLFTDGFSDQFGGDEGKKFMSKNFKRLLAKTSDLSLKEQAQELEKAYTDWINFKNEAYNQVDDITILGIEI